MPVYRPEPRFFAEAVDSVLAQTFRDLELVIVEDPSDRTGREVIAQRSDPRIRYFLNSERTSLPRQHNRAVAESRGELIARFDADDVCEPDRIEKQVEFLREHPDIDVLGSQLRIIDEAGQVIAVRHFPIDHASIRSAFPHANQMSGSNVMFRRRVVETIGGWRETSPLPSQDYEWYSRAILKGFRFANHPQYLVRYRLHQSQIKSTKTRQTILSDLEIREMYWSRELGFAGRVTALAERLVLLLPVRVTLWLVRRLRYRTPAA
jgi:glycosyltransferase involved in cell wall biosynthesis